MSNKLYVGNIPFNATEDDIQNVFEKAGKVLSVRIIKDKFSGQSKGFGFVEMETPEEAGQAISQLAGAEVLNRPLRVSEAREQTENRGPRPSYDR